MGGQKRGRTQRRHFRHGRENVWKYGNKKTRPEEERTTEDPHADPNPNPSWEPFATRNSAFDEYYKGQGILSEEEWEEFINVLRNPLPAAFRINASGQFFEDIRVQLENEFMKSLDAEFNNEEMENIRPLPWYPDKLAWHLNFSRMQLRKNQTLERFHEFLKQENEVGAITRQEAVSMVPPLFLDVLPDHYVLDKEHVGLMCLHNYISFVMLQVIANDVDVQRCNLLIHQTKRMCSSNLIVTNHEAQHFPSLSVKDCPREEPGEVKKNILQFDRVLCDVPCSGDGTLRKAPDIWRKWNSGMGNGLHRLQVEITMRGLSLLKVGGRMVYSTCSMNPVENEAVVAEVVWGNVLRRCEGSVELLDVSSELPELVRRPGLRTWKVRDKGLWLATYEDVPMYRRGVILPSMFCYIRSCQDNVPISDVEQDVTLVNCSELYKDSSIDPVDHPGNVRMSESCIENSVRNIYALDVRKGAGKVEDNCTAGASLVHLTEIPLERCMRILPHDQNSGAFFIAVLHKISSLSVNASNQSTRMRYKKNTNHDIGNEDQEPARSSMDVSLDKKIVAGAASASNLSPAVSDGTGCKLQVPCPFCSDKETANVEALDKGEDLCRRPLNMGEDGGNGQLDNSGDGSSGVLDESEDCSRENRKTKGNVQMQGRWRGVDPVVFFRDEKTINSIRSFYGISDLFLLDGHLVTRNSDANHVKRIYYISKSAHDIVELNAKVGQKLKITSLGLKYLFPPFAATLMAGKLEERQTSKDVSSATCHFRLSSEGLPLLLPYITKQILCVSLVDFRHLLQYRVIKFPDFVDADFREKLSALMSGCCVIVLKEGKQATSEVPVDSSSIAIVCWKGKTNLSIMVSQLDAQELMDRLAVRFGPREDSASEGSNYLLDENLNSDSHFAEMEVFKSGTVGGSEAAAEEEPNI
ncbi:multisite-specific tRNA:(cytosine-C5)-methyltransferase [Apostasia shenzhenica]|uniref:Multisite-specific tRNA:(Cytosine-C5)-methyltransferase n=1 Tax=Apostasia shenzhenica TaxID=1088818 RepID=A0A2I0BDJ4_9ASPA|nr:multisite-specific tRNA:(cytosine-C5)-methyltransferase [Apostasia shenzhenica]